MRTWGLFESLVTRQNCIRSNVDAISKHERKWNASNLSANFNSMAVNRLSLSKYKLNDTFTFNE